MDIDFIICYSALLLKEGYREADELKNSKIPDVLYKYYPCIEDRVNSLSNQKLWLAQYDTFNDPNEFRFMFIDEDEFEKAELIGQEWIILRNYYKENLFKVCYQDATKFMEKSKKIVSISCFTTNPKDNYFWSQYANERNGFCVEYAIGRKNNFYPVIYTDEKIEISAILKTYLANIKKDNQDEREFMEKYGKKYNIISDAGMGCLSFLYFNYCCKELKWKKENEYRLVFANHEPQISKGKLIPYSRLNITVNKIFIGDNCSEKDRKILEKIARNIGAEYTYI